MLRAASGLLERRLDLIEEKDDAGIPRQPPGQFEIAGLRLDAGTFEVDRLEDEEGDLVAMFLNRLLQCLRIVVRNGADQIGHDLGNTG